ncbi:MAG: MFS transporter [Actinomycetota bacterium]
MTGLLTFVAGSLAADFADTGTVLLAGRIAQGIGAAMLSPTVLSVVVRLFEGDERNRVLSIWSAPARRHCRPLFDVYPLWVYPE